MNRENAIKNNADAYYFHQGTATRAYEYLGAHRIEEKEGKYVYAFRTFAYRANSIELAGDFNSWGGEPLTRISESGIWELLYESDIPIEGMRYKYRVFSDDRVTLKADPFAQYSEWGTHTASIVWGNEPFEWQDKKWLDNRSALFKKKGGFYRAPMNIYEVHLASFKTRDGKSTVSGDAYLNYRELAAELKSYLLDMGYTHIELMPIMEHPYDGSWGYQTTGYFAPTSRFGNPDDFRFFVDTMHRAGIGVILDWVPAHFPKDEHGLFEFDGHRMYEYQGDDRVENKNWGTRYFDVGRPEVQSFLISNALFWFREYHIDGLRADAVASMLYLDYDKKAGEWLPNQFGGNENIEAVEFWKKLNRTVFAEFSDVLMIAEESTAWPMVTAPVDAGGLGFSFKWNMGWANDLFDYVQTDPYFRAGKHSDLTFSLMYAFGENYILPVSHDEVAHGKKSLLDKMYGGYDDKFAGVRVFLGYMMTHPGKKMLFMGSEFGQFREWDHENQLEWFLSDFEAHEKLKNYVRALNHYYLYSGALWERDFSPNGFEWIYADRKDDNLISFKRIGDGDREIICIMNFSPVFYSGYEIEVGETQKFFCERFNSDAAEYGGKGRENRGLVEREGSKIYIDIPPLSALIFEPIESELLEKREMTVEVIDR